MADPTANNSAIKPTTILEEKEYPMDKASMTLYQGQFISSDTTGYAVKSSDTAAHRFLGLCTEKQATQASASAAADGTNYVKVVTKGKVRCTVTSVAATSVGEPVFITDSATLQLTPSEVFVGWVDEYVTTNTAIVDLAGDFQPPRETIPFNCGTTSANATFYGGCVTMQRNGRVMAASFCAVTAPNYNTTVADADIRDISASATLATVNAADVDAGTNLEPTSLTLTTTSASRNFAQGDSMNASVTTGTSQTTAGVACTVTVLVEYYGRQND